MPNVLDLLRGRLQQRADNAVDVLAQAARDHANGQTVDVGAVEAALLETRQTADDFAKLCEIAGRRREALLAVEKLVSASNKVAKTVAAIDAENRRFEEIRLAYAGRIEALDAERAAAHTVAAAAERGRSVLLDPKLVLGTLAERYRQAMSERDDASSMVAALERELKEAASEVKSEEGWIAQLSQSDSETSYRLQDHVNAKRRAERRVTEATSQLSDARKVLAQASSKLAEVEALVLKA
jgi:chromosome segregation ATPase